MSVDQRENAATVLKGYLGVIKADADAIDVIDAIIAAVKEECCSGSQKWEIAANFEVRTAEPVLIQGYTAEQWAEIIDGGYLCEVGGEINEWYDGIIKISHINRSKCISDKNGVDYTYCRPARLKGVLKPIWVEPVDKKAMCVFFNKNSLPIGINGTVTSASLSYTEFINTLKDRGATSYMER